MALKKTDEAIAEFREALRFEPGNPVTHNNLGNALEEQKQLPRPSPSTARPSGSNRISRSRTTTWGIVLRNQKRLAEAIAEYRTALRLTPDDGTVHYNLGNALRDVGKVDEAIDELREAIRLKPDYVAAHTNLGNALLDDQQQVDEAMAEYTTAIRLDPDEADAHNGPGNVLQAKGRPDEAITEYRKALKVRPEIAMYHSNLGNALLAKERPDEAITEYRKALKIRPETATYHSNLGNALLAKGKRDEAFTEYRTALRIKPDDASAHNNLAWLMVVTPGRPRREYDEGVEHSRTAVKLGPPNPNFYGTLSLAEFRAGHFDESLAASQRAMRSERACTPMTGSSRP